MGVGPESPRGGGLADTVYGAQARVAKTALGRSLGLRAHGAAEAAVKTKGILLWGGGRGGDAGRGLRTGPKAKERVQWKKILVADDAGEDAGEDEARRVKREAAAELEDRVARFYKLVRLPILAYEQLAIPLRLAFAVPMIEKPLPIALDVAVDLFELAIVVHSVRREFRLHQLAHAPGHLARATADDEDEPPYTLGQLLLDLLTVAVLVVGRLVFLLGGPKWPWMIAQVVRASRVRQLMSFMGQLNADLTTNVTVFAIFKFALVVFSVPHWVGCVWWIICEYNADGGSFAAHTGISYR